MLLTDAQLEEFDREGYLFLPSCFSKEEMALLASEAEGIYAEDRKEVWRESIRRAAHGLCCASHL